MTTKFIPKPYRIERNDCQAMLIDIQEKLAPHIAEHRKLLKKTAILIQGLQALNIPIMVNEQYPKGLGHTLPELTQLLSEKIRQCLKKQPLAPVIRQPLGIISPSKIATM